MSFRENGENCAYTFGRTKAYFKEKFRECLNVEISCQISVKAIRTRNFSKAGYLALETSRITELAGAYRNDDDNSFI
jgi:hypothetical protein